MIAPLALAPFVGVAAQYFVLGLMVEHQKLEPTITFQWLKENVLRFGPAAEVFPELEAAVRFLVKAGQITVEGEFDKPDTWKLRLAR